MGTNVAGPLVWNWLTGQRVPQSGNQPDRGVARVRESGREEWTLGADLPSDFLVPPQEAVEWA